MLNSQFNFVYLNLRTNLKQKLTKFENRLAVFSIQGSQTEAKQVAFSCFILFILPALPSINIPIFSGSYKSWITFYQLFESVIHNRTDLTKIQKFFLFTVLFER